MALIHVNKEYTASSMYRSHRWAQRSINSFQSKNLYNSCSGSAGNQKLYGIIQGGIYLDLRDESIEYNLNNKSGSPQHSTAPNISIHASSKSKPQQSTSVDETTKLFKV